MRRGFLQLFPYKNSERCFERIISTTAAAAMGSPDQQSPHRTESAPTTQVMAVGALSTQRLVQLMQALARRSCSRACQLFCLPPLEKRKPSPDQTLHLQEENCGQERLMSPPSTVLIVNISNSTLNNCVIGNSAPSAAAAARQPLLQELQKAAERRCSCCHRRQEAAPAAQSEAPHPPPEHLNINIHGSCLNSVIVGDNNCMHVPENDPFD